MSPLVTAVYHAAVRYFNGDAKRIQHFTKVLQFATLIGEGEALCEKELETLQIAAVLHDIGIPESERKYHSAAGNYQQLEGPPVAKKLLAALGVGEGQAETVCGMIALHHTYGKIGDNLLLRILVEADMLVNAYEEEIPQENLAAFVCNVVHTSTGKALFREIYGV